MRADPEDEMGVVIHVDMYISERAVYNFLSCVVIAHISRVISRSSEQMRICIC